MAHICDTRLDLEPTQAPSCVLLRKVSVLTHLPMTSHPPTLAFDTRSQRQFILHLTTHTHHSPVKAHWLPPHIAWSTHMHRATITCWVRVCRPTQSLVQKITNACTAVHQLRARVPSYLCACAMRLCLVYWSSQLWICWLVGGPLDQCPQFRTRSRSRSRARSRSRERARLWPRSRRWP